MASEVDTGAVRAGIGSRRAAIIADVVASGLAVAVFAPVLYYMVQHWSAVPDY